MMMSLRGMRSRCFSALKKKSHKSFSSKRRERGCLCTRSRIFALCLSLSLLYLSLSLSEEEEEEEERY
jgi:hypothetical protein